MWDDGWGNGGIWGGGNLGGGQQSWGGWLREELSALSRIGLQELFGDDNQGNLAPPQDGTGSGGAGSSSGGPLQGRFLGIPVVVWLLGGVVWIATQS